MYSGMPLNLATLFDTHESERFDLHTRRLNEQMVRVLRTIGYDVGFCKGQGQYLYDRKGERYLDLLSGYGVFAVGRNHQAIRAALKSVLDADLPNLVQMDVSTLAGLLAERLLALVPHLEKLFFANSGSESVEAAIKFARAATGRPGVVYCSHAFHGLTYGALSLSGGHVPVGAVLMRKSIYDKVFSRMDRAVVHGSTFGKNDLAMAAGIATLEVMKAERVMENAARMGERLLRGLSALCENYELLKEVRGKGLMIGV